MEAIYTRLGRELKRVRRDRRLTQEDLADRVGLGRTSIVNIEKGEQRIYVHTLLDLARALQVSPAELLPQEPRAVAEIAGEVDTLPAPERDWVMKVLSPPPAEKGRKRRGKTS